jgi:hypothetical protein
MGKILVVSGSLFKARLLKTGQVTTYGSGTGVDDGALKKGIAKAYVVLTSGRFSGTTTITHNAKDDVHSNNCVLDRKTGLMWSRYVSASVGPLSDGKLPWTTDVNGDGIFPYCAAANAAQLAGYSDWRIPNVYELMSIASYLPTLATSVPNTTAFPSWPATLVWSSTARTSNPDTRKQYFDFNLGSAGAQPDTSTLFCALVRGG